MPTESAHISLANQNQELIHYLLERRDDFSPWIVTVAFYKALHLVEAVFARDPDIGHGHGHENRDRLLKEKKRYSHIYRHYRPLWAASMVARYLEDPGGKYYRSFADYLSPEGVEREMLRHRLRQIQKSVRKFLSSAAKAALK